jgi:hypothetical protein
LERIAEKGFIGLPLPLNILRTSANIQLVREHVTRKWEEKIKLTRIMYTPVVPVCKLDRWDSN